MVPKLLGLEKVDKARTLYNNKPELAYTMELEFDAIRGHKSAASFAVGPDMAEPFISPLLLTITPALSSK